MNHFPSADIGPFGRRQRHMRGHRIPVSIVRDGEAPRERDTAVVVDAFGAGDIAPAAACACCTVRVKLRDALRRLSDERQQRHFSRVAIETREDVRPILRTFIAARALGDAFHVEGDPPDMEGVTRFTLTEDAPLPWAAFSRFVTILRALRGADLLHVRCTLNVAGCRGPVAVQFMQHLASRPVELEAWPDDDRTSRLAFVTRGIEAQAVRSLFDAVRG